MVANGNPHKDSLCRISHLGDGSMVSCSLVRGCMCWGVRGYRCECEGCGVLCECEGVRELCECEGVRGCGSMCEGVRAYVRV